ncbi:redoxin domain-containing protein [Prolixibacteraceae bacterium JC049]|nr:redoxin domain-containing protein [Prolixibacteraceae bacterium JC049]
MNRYFFLTLFILIASIGVQGQKRIELELAGEVSQEFYLKQITRDKHILVDSAKCVNNQVVFNGHYENGMYYIQHKYSAFTFLVNEEKMVFKADCNDLRSSLKVLESEENSIWLTYIKRRDIVYKRLKMITPITNWYDPNTLFYSQAVEEFNNVQNSFRSWCRNAKANSMAKAFLMADLKPALAHNKTFEEQKEHLKMHWFDNVNWEKRELINSDILSNKIRDFLGLYTSRNFNAKQLEEAFCKAIDQFLPLVIDYPEMYGFVLEFLTKEMERYGMDAVVVHMATNYPLLDEKCHAEGDLAEQLKQYAKMGIGKIAPDITTPIWNEKSRKGKVQFQKKTLLVFWSTACPHCTHLIPYLDKWYKKAKTKGWQLITVSLDVDQKTLKEFIIKNSLDFTVLCDFNGWKGKAVVDYNIHSTPAMMVLDADRKIIDKPNRFPILD